MLTTQCPDCGTVFRVTPEQLRARAGKVRCGRCGSGFDALDRLLDSAPAVAAEPAAVVDQSAAGRAEAVSAGDEKAPPQEAVRGEAIDILLEGVAQPAPAQARWPAFAWAVASLLALALLLGQVAYWLRAELAVSQPELRPLLQQMCALLDCEIPLPRKAELLGIEASDLHPDPQRPTLLVLTATLKNHAPFVQAHPHLELTLTDVHDQPIIRRVFAPADYLVADAAGFAANAELPLTLWLDAGEAGASGYRLYLFYP